ncbi:MAG: alpha/beta hydrolase, partial [Acidimicrobiia bacterium]
MPLAPAARNLLDAMAAAGTPPLWELSIEDVRANRELLGGLEEPVPVADVEDRVVPGPGGDLPVRIYTPDGDSPRPLIVYFHGGGFVFCSLDTHDNTCRRLANATGAVVVSVDYRLAPEHCFPAPLDDCYAATVWAHEHAGELGADADRLVVAGDSAGGNLAAATALMARDGGGPPIRFQLLVYPVIDAACDAASYVENAEGYFLEAEAMRWFWRQYLGPDGNGNDPLATPLGADLAALPPALVVTAEFDPLRDEGEAYGAALADAGVSVTVRRYDGMIHGFWSMPMFFPEADDATSEITAALSATL